MTCLWLKDINEPFKQDVYLWSNFECQIHVLFINSLALNAIEFLAFIKYMKHIGTNIIINSEHFL